MNTTSLSLGNSKLTLDLLWKRIRQRGDLPGFARVIGAILGAMHGEDDREFNMTKTVLDDPVLTQKVLRLANSAMYAMFGQGINTVSKAVIVLGTDSIGHLALGLKLIDGLSSASSESAAARREMDKAVLAGHIARHMASSASTRDAEEAVVCSMLHNLGRMMATFYLSDMWSLAQAHDAGSGAGHDRAVRDVFGLGLDELSRAVARQWGLPPTLIESLRDVPPYRTEEPLEHVDWLAAMSTMSVRCAALLCEGDGGHEDLLEIVNGYADMLGMEPEAMMAAIDLARKSAAEDAVTLPPDSAPAGESVPGAKPADSALILARGVTDLREATAGASTGQLMTMALETVYQGLGLTRAIAFLRDPVRGAYVARMYFGEEMQELMPRLSFDDAYRPDVFHAALAHDKMIFVDNAQDPAFNSKLPRWWRDAVPASVHCFMVLPLTVNRQPAGFLYGDWDGEKAVARLEPSEIAPLNELRTLMAQALERRRHDRTGWMI